MPISPAGNAAVEALSVPLNGTLRPASTEVTEQVCEHDDSTDWACLLFGVKGVQVSALTTFGPWLDTLRGSVPLAALRRACLRSATPDSFRPWTWLVLLGVLPPVRAAWRTALAVRLDMYRECLRFAMITGLQRRDSTLDTETDHAIDSIFHAHASYQVIAGEPPKANRMDADEHGSFGCTTLSSPVAHAAASAQLTQMKAWLEDPAKSQERSTIRAQINVFRTVFPEQPALAWWCLNRFREQERRVAVTRSGQAIESFDFAYRVRLVLHLVDIAEQEAKASSNVPAPRAKEPGTGALQSMRQSRRIQGFSALLGAMLMLTRLPANHSDGQLGSNDTLSAQTDLSINDGRDRLSLSVKALFEHADDSSDISQRRSRTMASLDAYTRCLLGATFAEHLSPAHCLLLWDRIFAAGPDLAAHLAFQLLVQLRLHQLGPRPLHDSTTSDASQPGDRHSSEMLTHPSWFLSPNDIEAICRRASDAADYLLGYESCDLSTWDPIYAFDMLWPVLRRGDTGALVRILQYLLRCAWLRSLVRRRRSVWHPYHELGQTVSKGKALMPMNRGVFIQESLEAPNQLGIQGERPSSPASAQSLRLAATSRASGAASVDQRAAPWIQTATSATDTPERYLGDLVDEQLWPRLVVPVSAGDRGDAVMALQVALLELHGYDSVRIDGFFGRRTEAAVREFQRRGAARLMPIDGLVGPVTWLHLIGRGD
ncbi:hypothetical protein F1559_003828 [Cyanidiococcus yangmingshanensis]|uniref:Peptidoglycan binding-like domain-containing protein n=1 Tax=Cyanidiococcus yangmingshanensis TaxID=2690220 RepID=A0A7J7IQ78_9RHOD|nr:hypothetical protein F1559_003828 [Cyanidiococcus yangmingshanensis]